MYTIEKVVREYNGNKKEVNAFFGKGRFTADAPAIRTAKEHQVMSAFGFSLAIDNFVNGEKQTVFYPLVLWEKTAENLQKISASVLKAQKELGLEEKGLKGREALVFGRIEKQTYKNKEGVQKEQEVLVVERFDFADYPKAPKGSSTSSDAPAVNNAPSVDSLDGIDGVSEEELEDLPF